MGVLARLAESYDTWAAEGGWLREGVGGREG